jgi:hypothetical protein
LGRTRDNEEAAALVRQIADRIAELKRLMLGGRSGENGAAILTLDCGNSARAANIKRPDAM